MTDRADIGSHVPFGFTDEQLLFRESMRGFARSKLADTYHARATSDEFPADAYRLLVDQGVLGLTVPERLGGQGADDMAYAIAMEELAWADINMAGMALLPSIVAMMLTGDDVAEQTAARIANGTLHVGLCLTEP